MKKAIFLGVFLVFSVPFIASAAFDTNLKYGASGTAVKEMQEFLVDQKACNITPSGNFFSLTLSCVKNFQINEGISPASGYWGPLTRAKATEKINLGASVVAEQNETGTVTAPITDEKFAQLLAILNGIQAKSEQQAQQIALQNLQLQAQTQLQQQIATNTGTITPPPVVIDNTPKETTFDNLAWIAPHPSVNSFNMGIVKAQIGDKITLSLDNQNYIFNVDILGNMNRTTGYWLSIGEKTYSAQKNATGTALTPNTEYSYSMKIERGNEYATTSGKFKTLAQ